MSQLTSSNIQVLTFWVCINQQNNYERHVTYQGHYKILIYGKQTPYLSQYVPCHLARNYQVEEIKLQQIITGSS